MSEVSLIDEFRQHDVPEQYCTEKKIRSGDTFSVLFHCQLRIFSSGQICAYLKFVGFATELDGFAVVRLELPTCLMR